MDINDVSRLYQQLDKQNLHLLKGIYHDHVVFEDPAHRVEGKTSLVAYFEELYTNVIKCDFDIEQQQQFESQGFLTWTMSLQHPKLNRGQPISVKGASHIQFEQGFVIYHRDYFDLGEMLYEHIVVLGGLIKGIKKRLGN
ncbi:nuclear transport factor 2 family protein [Vibrio methylphosphonaticus]|uniref:nuclear transport factor 2 family protein n=1 Tax=Vibrio methylphosphonaticus TaxID=2946866 RepID=UPI00202AA229|nr:nuclear transport factor 2 family protein [Vibrio methylphosphonaticus]MCL9774355.1 nuclear transport factor 2 family protein [Vibrio methylphosphonaticus]